MQVIQGAVRMVRFSMKMVQKVTVRLTFISIDIMIDDDNKKLRSFGFKLNIHISKKNMIEK